MPLNFPSSSLTLGQLYEGWVWNGSAWDFVGRSVGITTTASPTTTTTTAAVSIPVVTLIGIAQSNESSLATFTGAYTGSDISETGFVQTASETIPAYPGEHFETGSASSPFELPDKSTNFGSVWYWRAYAVNPDGIGYSAAYPWGHLNLRMPNLTRTGNNINCEFTFAAGVGAALNSEIDEIGFVFNYINGSLPTWEDKEDYVVATQSPVIPTTSPFRVTATISSGPDTNVRAYIRYTGGFYWYSLDAKFVTQTTTTTTSTTSTTTTTTLPQPWIGSINSASNYTSPATSLTLSTAYTGGSNITEAGIKSNTTSSPVGATEFISGTTGSPYSTTITGLFPAAERYFWSYAVVNGTEVISEEDGLSKWYFWYQYPAVAPVLSQSGAGNPIVANTSVGVGSAAEGPYEVGVVWSKSNTNPTLTTGTKVLGSLGASQWSTTITGIIPGTYYVRPFVRHADQANSGTGLVWYGSMASILAT